MSTLAPPVATDAVSNRWAVTRLRRRIIYGEWMEDLRARMRELVGNVRQEAWGRPDMSANPLRALCVQMATLYGQPPDLHNDGATQAQVADLDAALAESGLWSLMQRVQRDTLAMREMMARVDTTSDGQLRYRPVFPDMVRARTDPDDPLRVVWLAELRERDDLRLDPRGRPRGGKIWTWDVLSIEGEEASYRIMADDQATPTGEDLSALYLTRSDGTPATGGLRGPEYPFRYSTVEGTAGPGEAFLPVVVYHAARSGTLWDFMEWHEVVEASLNIGVYWSLWGHIVRAASWPQRYAAGVLLEGVTVGPDGRRELTTDPASVVIFGLDPEFEGQPVIGQWEPGGDPVAIADSISAYERRVAGYVGLSPADIHRVSGDPRSGYAIAITQEAQRTAQRYFEPVFRTSDEELLRKSAALLNRWAESGPEDLGPPLPELGWWPAYQALPLSSEERRSRREDALELLREGLATREHVIMELYQVTAKEARALLKRIDREREERRPDTNPNPEPGEPGEE